MIKILLSHIAKERVGRWSILWDTGFQTNANENSSNKDYEGVQFVIVDFYFC